MSTDDKIRAILRMEADSIDPSPAGWDAIQDGIAARGARGWWTRGAALAGVAAVLAGVVVYVTNDTSRQGIDQSPTTSRGPSSSTSPSPTPSPAPDVPNEPISAIWPLTTTHEVIAWERDNTLYPSLASAQGAALAFTRTYLGISDATITGEGGPNGESTFEVVRDGVNVSRLTVRGFGTDGTAPFVVTLARSDALTLAVPVEGSHAGSPLRVSGTYEAVDPAIDVTVRADASSTAPVQLGKARAETSPANNFTADVAFTTKATTGSVLVTLASLKDGGVAAAVAVPVTFGEQVPEPETMVAERDGRIAVLSTTTGDVVRWLTQKLPEQGGAGDPEVSEDGRTVVYVQVLGPCESEIRSVSVAGGKPTRLVGAGEGMLSSPSKRGDVLAYARSTCEQGATMEVVIRGQETLVEPVTGDLWGGPVVGERFVTYSTMNDRRSVLHSADANGEFAESTTAAPTGCHWVASTWGARDLNGREQVFAATRCGSAESRLYRTDADGRNLRLLDTIDALEVSSLDWDEERKHLLLGGDGAWVHGPTPRRIPGAAGRPSWS